MNPATMAQQQKADDIEKLQKENEVLRAKLQGLEGKEGCVASDIPPTTSKEVEGKQKNSVSYYRTRCLAVAT